MPKIFENDYLLFVYGWCLDPDDAWVSTDEIMINNLDDCVFVKTK